MTPLGNFEMTYGWNISVNEQRFVFDSCAYSVKTIMANKILQQCLFLFS